MQGMSGAKGTNIESKSFHIVIVEEAQDMDSHKVKKSIHPMLSAYNGTIIKIGTPNNKRCDFLDAINRNKRLDSKKKHSQKKSNRKYKEE